MEWRLSVDALLSEATVTPGWSRAIMSQLLLALVAVAASRPS